MAEKAKTKKHAPAPKGNDQKCGVEGCKRAYRAKTYCFFHFKKWRAGELPHPRYRTCSNETCRKMAGSHGRCEAHAAAKRGDAAPAAAAVAAPAAAPAA